MLLRLVLVLFCACTPDPAPRVRCDSPRPAGDLSQAVELLPIALDGKGTLQALHAGDSVLLQKPPQGGYVIYAGAAARNLEACGAQVTAQLDDPAGGAPITNLDQRLADFTEPRDGYFWPSNGFVQTANIPACPDALHKGVAGRSAILHVEVIDKDGRMATLDLPVTPACAAGDTQCACLCGPNPGGC